MSRVRMPVHWPVTSTGHGEDHIENISSVARMRVHWPVTSTGHGEGNIENTSSVAISFLLLRARISGVA
jgi:hypothetical protein